MRYIVDGYNLFFWLENDPLPLEQKREDFLEALSEIVKTFEIQVHVIFDSCIENSKEFASKRLLSSQIKVSFSPKHLTADEFILETFEWNGKNTILVTSDIELSRKSADFGVETISTEDFINLLKKKRKQNNCSEQKPQKDTQKSIERLNTIFSKRLGGSDGL